MADATPVSVGKLPAELENPAPHLDRDQHILVRRDNPPMPREEDELDPSSVRDPETDAILPSVHRLPSGNIRRDL